MYVFGQGRRDNNYFLHVPLIVQAPVAGMLDIFIWWISYYPSVLISAKISVFAFVQYYCEYAYFKHVLLNGAYENRGQRSM